uniref:Uncharacterized protein n=1 Tax=Anguilla anguilla TaxID=7936 RepID=A0A0E9STK4_ANGAN
MTVQLIFREILPKSLFWLCTS